MQPAQGIRHALRHQDLVGSPQRSLEARERWALAPLMRAFIDAVMAKRTTMSRPRPPTEASSLRMSKGSLESACRTRARHITRSRASRACLQFAVPQVYKRSEVC